MRFLADESCDFAVVRALRAAGHDVLTARDVKPGGAKDLIANDETEISEVVRRRLFEDLGSEKIRRNIAKSFADWCFERRAQLPPEWTAVDSAATEAKAREFLQRRFEACYPFHPRHRVHCSSTRGRLLDVASEKAA